MSTRLTPVSVAEREIKRWREREIKLQRELYDVTTRLEQWEAIRIELLNQAPQETESEAVAS